MMHKRSDGLFAIPALFAVVLFLRSYSAGGIGTQPTLSGPVLEYQSLIDIGCRERGESVTIDFPLANRGDQDLIVSDLRTGCACTVAKRAGDRESQQQQFTIEPNCSTSISLRVTVEGRIGESRTFPCAFRTND